jgi:hypothetical protein
MEMLVALLSEAIVEGSQGPLKQMRRLFLSCPRPANAKGEMYFFLVVYATR